MILELGWTPEDPSPLTRTRRAPSSSRGGVGPRFRPRTSPSLTPQSCAFSRERRLSFDDPARKNAGSALSRRTGRPWPRDYWFRFCIRGGRDHSHVPAKVPIQNHMRTPMLVPCLAVSICLIYSTPTTSEVTGLSCFCCVSRCHVAKLSLDGHREQGRPSLRFSTHQRTGCFSDITPAIS